VSHTHSKLLYHCIFSTDRRRAQIKAHIRERLYAYMSGIARNCGGQLVRIGGTVDHVHLLVELDPPVSVAEMMRLVKANSSKWIHETFSEFGDFEWQAGYAAFTVSVSAMDEVIRYIERQEEHHRTRSFEDELSALMARHGIAPAADRADG
jgi:REP element-mobilizing transposase RayT